MPNDKQAALEAIDHALSLLPGGGKAATELETQMLALALGHARGKVAQIVEVKRARRKKAASVPLPKEGDHHV